MNKQDVIHWLTEQLESSSQNSIQAENAISPELVGLKMFDLPLVGISSAQDPLFREYKTNSEAIGPHYMTPEEWLPGAVSVISVFLPFTQQVKRSNAQHPRDPSDEWLHGRIEGQVFVSNLTRELKSYLESQGAKVVAPGVDSRFWAVEGPGQSSGIPPTEHPAFGSNWSERHAAFVAGLGTFGLSKGLITKKGVAGRFTSVITNLPLTPDPRTYTELYEYCNHCGKCILQCPAHAISFEKGKEHAPCKAYLLETKAKYLPRFGCGKCQVAVPCESGIPEHAEQAIN